MTLHYADDWLTVYHGDAATELRSLPSESVHMVCSSPPYWGLRDYGEPGQLGLEATPEAYVAALVEVFREVRRVLRSDGTVWLNLGDSYNSAASNQNGIGLDGKTRGGNAERGRNNQTWPGAKPKDLVGIPWMVAFALRADGWYLRSDIIWSKPNPMPESVTDRPTKSHEYLFLLSKSARYYFDADAVREEDTGGTRYPQRKYAGTNAGLNTIGPPGAGRNIRSVWTVATQPYPGAHFATFPPKLIEPCIKAGTSERGVCPECGAPWERVAKRSERDADYPTYDGKDRGEGNGLSGRKVNPVGGSTIARFVSETTGWRRTCLGSGCIPFDAEPVPATVLDPFAGSGTTGLVAQRLSRRAVLVDLSMDYLGQLMDRNRDIPLGLGA